MILTEQEVKPASLATSSQQIYSQPASLTAASKPKSSQPA
jgi:hypothetical protein